MHIAGKKSWENTRRRFWRGNYECKEVDENICKMYHSVRLLLCGEGYRRAEYIRKHKLFGSMGENCYWHPWKMPGDPELIFIHDNVKIASDVTFINHDISNALLNTKYKTNKFKYFTAPTEIFDNVLIGTGTIILPGKKIGPNCVVGGGASSLQRCA